MKTFIDIMRQAYLTRDASLIPQLSAYLDDDCVTFGTSQGEFSHGKAGFETLLRDDFKYWVDIDIQNDYQTTDIGDYRLYTLSALAHCTFVVNEKTYARYAGYMRDIAKESISEYAKAVKVIWELDHLLASKPGVRHKDDKPLTIDLLTKNNKVVHIAFNLPREKNHVDCIAGTQPDMDEGFREDIAFFTRDDALTERIAQAVFPDGLRFDNVTAQAHGDWFVGCGTLENAVSVDDEIKRDFRALDEDGTAYRRLYTLRKRLGETLRLYAYGEKQSVMTRFFGVLQDGEIVYFKHMYPYYWILED